MEIEIERSGGFTGLTVRSTVSAADLSPADIDAIVDLVRRCGDDRDSAAQAVWPDAYQFDITVRDGVQDQHATVLESSLDPDDRRLLARLLERSGHY